MTPEASAYILATERGRDTRLDSESGARLDTALSDDYPPQGCSWRFETSLSG